MITPMISAGDRLDPLLGAAPAHGCPGQALPGRPSSGWLSGPEAKAFNWAVLAEMSGAARNAAVLLGSLAAYRLSRSDMDPTVADRRRHGLAIRALSAQSTNC